MTSIKNRLILSLAYRPLTHNALEELIDRTATRSKQILQELQDEKTQTCNDSDKRDDSNTTTATATATATTTDSQNHRCQDHTLQQNNSNNNNHNKDLSTSSKTQPNSPPYFENRNPTAHVLVTGSPSITQPGRSFDNWETQWTPGEQVLGQYIQKVGLHHFHRIPQDGEVRLNGKLVDVKQKDFTVFDSLEEQLNKEFHWIADNVKQHFNLYAKVPVSEAIILYPEEFVGEEDEDEDEDDEVDITVQDVVDMIQRVFQSEWSQKKGPLCGVRIRVEIVASSK